MITIDTETVTPAGFTLAGEANRVKHPFARHELFSAWQNAEQLQVVRDFLLEKQEHLMLVQPAWLWLQIPYHQHKRDRELLALEYNIRAWLAYELGLTMVVATLPCSTEIEFQLRTKQEGSIGSFSFVSKRLLR